MYDGRSVYCKYESIKISQTKNRHQVYQTEAPLAHFICLWKSSVLQPVHTGSKVSDVIVMEIEVKGSTEPYQVLLEPYAVVIPGEIFIFTTTRRQFKVI